jgi:hypothetical protein
LALQLQGQLPQITGKGPQTTILVTCFRPQKIVLNHLVQRSATVAFFGQEKGKRAKPMKGRSPNAMGWDREFRQHAPPEYYAILGAPPAPATENKTIH